jgi:hypothetical protein
VPGLAEGGLKAIEPPRAHGRAHHGARPSIADRGGALRWDQGRPPQREGLLKMGIRVLYPVAMAAVIVAVDFAFFKNLFWARLMANIGIVLVFAAFYMRFFGVPSLPWK